MNVYILRYENLDVFSTARKVLEHAGKCDWQVDFKNGELIDINETTIKKLISQLNKEHFLMLASGSEIAYIEKEMVM